MLVVKQQLETSNGRKQQRLEFIFLDIGQQTPVADIGLDGFLYSGDILTHSVIARKIHGKPEEIEECRYPHFISLGDNPRHLIFEIGVTYVTSLFVQLPVGSDFLGIEKPSIGMLASIRVKIGDKHSLHKRYLAITFHDKHQPFHHHSILFTSKRQAAYQVLFPHLAYAIILKPCLKTLSIQAAKNG